MMPNLSEVDQIKKSIVFILGTKNDEPVGTGFILGVHPSPAAKGFDFACIVTAKHVLYGKQGRPLDSLGIRYNTVDGNVKGFEFPQPPILFEHPDSTVDAIMIPMTIIPRKLDVIALPPSMILTKTKAYDVGLGEGDDVIYAGLFSRHVGKSRNETILRFGKIALLPTERIAYDDYKSEDLYLVETLSFGGNSGAPVFFEIPLQRQPSFKSERLFLAGVLKGHFLPDRGHFPEDDLRTLQTLGITGVTPAYKLFEIMETTNFRRFIQSFEDVTKS